MFVLLGLVISLICLLGYIYSAHHWLKIPFRLAPLFVINLLIMVLFWGALAEVLRPVTIALVAGGPVLGLLLLVKRVNGQLVSSDTRQLDTLLFLLGLVALAFAGSLTGAPSVVDDYAWWGIISKSIEMYQSLPGADTSIYPRHLTYLPGLALFHQFFYTALFDFHLTAAYFAQNLLLVALLFALTDSFRGRGGVTMVAVAIILLILFSGSVFQKLRVDHFLALASCVVVWIQLKYQFSWPRYAVAMSTIITLYLVKEVGLLLAVFLLVLVSVDLLFSDELSRKQKIRSVSSCLAVFLYILAQKAAWDQHCLSQGFTKFQGGIDLDAVVSAFNLFGNSESREAFMVFLREILVGDSDQLKLPYIVWYLALCYLWYCQLKTASRQVRSRYGRLIGCTFLFFIIYLAMNYVMQVSVFSLGATTETPTSLSRYVNIFFCWFVYFTVLAFVQFKLMVMNKSRKRWPQVILVISGLLLVGSSLPEEPEAYEREIDHLIPQLAERIETGSRVCITPGHKNDHYLGFRLLYRLFPTSFTVDPFPGQVKRGVDQIVATCDYLLIYLPDGNSQRYFGILTTEKIEHKSLFKVLETEPATLKRAL